MCVINAGILSVDRDGLMHQAESKQPQSERLTVSLATLSRLLDAHRSSVRRWLQEAGIRPIVLGRGRNGAIRYRWRDIQCWLEAKEQAD
jgi:hypothetical protein